MNCPSVPQKKKKKLHNFLYFLGRALTQLTNGKLVFLHMSLFACLAVRVLYLLVTVMMLTLITTDCTMLLMSSDNLRPGFSVFFIQVRLQDLLYLLTRCCYFF